MCGTAMLWLTHRQLKSKNVASRRKAVERLCDAPNPRALEGALRGAGGRGRGSPPAGRHRPWKIGGRRSRRAIAYAPCVIATRTCKRRRSWRSSEPRMNGCPPRCCLCCVMRTRACAAARRRCSNSSGGAPPSSEEEMWFLVAKGQCSRVAAFGAAALLPSRNGAELRAL